ncbi:hypothetical protein HispidOSU_009659 [Sigmodon hispidus]
MGSDCGICHLYLWQCPDWDGQTSRVRRSNHEIVRVRKAYVPRRTPSSSPPSASPEPEEAELPCPGSRTERQSRR